MYRKEDKIFSSPREQHAIYLADEISAEYAPQLFSVVIRAIAANVAYRYDLQNGRVEGLHPAEHTTQTAAVEARLTMLDKIKLKLGELAAPEIIQASLEAAEEFKGKIDLTRLYEE